MSPLRGFNAVNHPLTVCCQTLEHSTCIMKATQPKLLPTLICLAVVGLLAAVLPYPGLENGFNLLNHTSAKD